MFVRNVFRISCWSIFLSVLVQAEDTKCVTSNGEEGKCVYLLNCPSAQRDLQFKIYPQICSFNATSKIPTICCLDGNFPNSKKLTDIISPSSSPQENGHRNAESKDQEDNETSGCIANLNKAKPGDLIQGHVAWKKCLQYQEKVVELCEGNSQRMVLSFCHHLYNEDVIVGGGGINARRDEFPHMALLGYGKNYSEAVFGCGGSLISEKFVLTAGHCISGRDLGPVSFAVFGLLRREDTPSAPPESIYSITRIVRHPDYSPPSKYHDIALLELDREVAITLKVHPACLHVGDEVKETRAYATGWGSLGYRMENANILQNVPLWVVPEETCRSRFPIHRHLRRGYDNTTQLCYGDDGSPRDTCSGDSGGPLQISHKSIYCMYLVLGVTSFGNPFCAQIGYPGIYTRVAHYVPWIESVVWPSG